MKPPPTPRDLRMTQWSRDIYPKGRDIKPLAFELPEATQKVRARADQGKEWFKGLGLSGVALSNLITEIRRERTATHRERLWPSLADDKAQLRRILRQAQALRSELGAMSMRIEIMLNSEYHESNKNREEKARTEGELFDSDEYDHVRMQERQLPALIEAASDALAGMPYQARPFAQVHLVEVVAKALEPLGIKPSYSATSKFHRACEAAFDIANVLNQSVGKSRPRRPSPTGSIRAYMAKRGRNSRWTW